MEKKLNTIVHLLDDKQASHIVSIDMKETSPFVDYFVIASSSNIRQLNALKDHLIDEMAKQDYLVKRVEGLKESKWLLVDFGDIIVHLFEEEERQLFNLEKLWGDLPQHQFN